MDEHRSQAGGLIRGLRQEARLTQQQLAKNAGVSVGLVRDLEQGRTTRPHRESVRRLASALRLNRQQARELSLAAPGSPYVAARTAAPGAAGDLRIGILGPLAVWRRGVRVAVGPPMQRTVLGLLALHPGTGLSRSAIIDALWPDDPPATAVPMVQSYVSRLRSLLGPVCPMTGRNGYRLEAAACELDLVRFATLIRRARDVETAGELAVSSQMYAEALELWRGDPLADTEVLRDHPAVVRLSRQRADAVLGYAQVTAAEGLPDRALPQLQELTAREPLNERAHARLMIALAGSGQQAAALGAYDLVRQRLDNQLGVRPGAELAQAHAQVLSQQIPAAPSTRWPALPARTNAAPQHSASHEVPGHLPRAAAHFTGRVAELAALDTLLDQHAGEAIVISAIAGTAGVGKTALAIHWAHRVADRFPDGQLYVDLRGYDPAQPMPAADALAGFLRLLGVPGQDIPPGEGECAARYRSLLSGKRMLVVLDNAGSADQVRPLIPGTHASTAVVTSRDALAGLVARDGATRLDLDLLPMVDAVGLLRALIGRRVDAAPTAAAELAVQCCRLPLALRVAAERATRHPGVPLTELTGELADLHKRLDLLAAGGDHRTGVRAVLSWSYRHLDADAARTFRLLGLHPGPGFEPYAAAALTGMTAERVRQMLDVLARAHMIHVAPLHRYGMHDLLRAYARELADSDGGSNEHQALTRLFDYYLDTAAAAMDTLRPADRHWRPRVPTPATPIPPVTGAAEARGWLDAEQAVLVAITVHAAEHGWSAHATQLADTLFRYLGEGVGLGG